ncbi:hypothetical protein CY35_14G083200 [Sphagnum magellanicum]|nr:hypothetical protein CY35_14G083200 [Sphagnum magellanicum]
MSDKYFTGGAPATVLDPGRFVQQQERTVRFFPIAMGKKNCYVVNVPNGRYFIRMFFVYDDYDRQQHSPSFDVSVEGTVVFSWRNPWQDYFAQNGAYSDLFAFIHDGAATVCFYSIATDSPVIGALELLEVDELSYDSQSTGESVILVNYGRLTTGYESFGPGFTNDTDELGRGWEQDDFYSFSPKSILTTTQNILNTTLPPNYFPEKLYQACRSLAEGGSINYVFEVDSNLDYAIWLHFAEIDPSVKAQGQRVFDVRINNQVVLPNLDIYKLAGGPFSAYDWHFTVVNLTGSSLTIDFEAKIGPPLICGLEVYALLTADLTTNVTEAMAMQALRMSLNVPERMGWNGDPCAPTRWDPWEGVTCNLAVDKSGLIITNINISGQGLQGFISDQITLLTHLTTLNLSNNMLGGSIPAGLGLNSLTSVDLSGNLLTGNIPASLGSQQLQQLLLSNNQLSGQVPIPIYSMGVHGGFINLSSNAGLCGVLSLPKCPPFWRGGFSTGSKIARTKWYQNHRMSVHEAEDEHILQPHLSTKFGFSSNIAPL